MKDFNNIELQVGDPVAYITGSSTCQYLCYGIVAGFTSSYILINNNNKIIKKKKTKVTKI